MQPPITFSCRCGALLSAPPGVPAVTCYHCGATVGVPVVPPGYAVPAAAAAREHAPPPTARPSTVLASTAAVLTQLACVVAGLVGLLGLAIGGEARTRMQAAAVEVIRRIVFDHAGLWLMAGLAGFIAAAFVYRRASVVALVAAAFVDGFLAIETFRLLGRIDDAVGRLRASGMIAGLRDDYSGPLTMFAIGCAIAATLCVIAIPRAMTYARWRAAQPPGAR